MDLCGIMYRFGEDAPNCIKSIPFGLLFQLYTVISGNAVGMLVRARRHELVTFEGEMLYQGQDDFVDLKLVALPEPVARELGLVTNMDQSETSVKWFNGEQIAKYNIE